MRILGKAVEKIYLRLDDNLVYYDTTTKCRTRYYYDSVVKTKYQQLECKVIFIDIDKLKTVNDTMGHSYGTELIKRVGQFLLSLPNTKEVCRIGGDEFVLICDTTFNTDELNKCHNNISYGFYDKEKYEDVSSAVKKADESMYKMKKAKKGQG